MRAYTASRSKQYRRIAPLTNQVSKIKLGIIIMGFTPPPATVQFNYVISIRNIHNHVASFYNF